METKKVQRAKQLIDGFQLPELPMEVVQLQQALQDDLVNIHSVLEIIEKNTVMAGELLGAVNRLVSKRGGALVTSVPKAVKILGLKNLYNLLVASALKNLYDGDILYQDIMNFSADVAFCMSDLAEYVEDVSPDEAYLLGLFHHVGVMVLFNHDPEGYAKIYKDSLSNPNAVIELEMARYGTTHPIIGAMIGKRWSLPKDLLNAILLHHTQAYSKIQDNYVRALVALNQLASVLIVEITLGKESTQALSETKQRAIQELMIKEEEVAEIQQTLIPYAYKIS